MNNISFISDRSIKICLWVLLFFMLTFLLTGQAFAQKEPEVSFQLYKINGKEAKEYLMEKYKVRKDDVYSAIQQTPNGPSGKLNIMGENITPVTVIATGDVKTRARSVAKAFLQEEAVLLGISNIDEIKEMSVNVYTSPYTNLTSTNIYYRRHINNLELENASIQITVGHDDKIKSVYAELIPTPPELIEITKKLTLAEDEAINIVKQDLLSGGIAPENILKLNIIKIAVQSQPYVVWKADAILSNGRWGYDINAFTGEIIKKKDKLVW